MKKYEKNVLGRILGRKRKEMRGDRTKLHGGRLQIGNLLFTSVNKVS
jgi:hypothetical protein